MLLLAVGLSRMRIDFLFWFLRIDVFVVWFLRLVSFSVEMSFDTFLVSCFFSFYDSSKILVLKKSSRSKLFSRWESRRVLVMNSFPLFVAVFPLSFHFRIDLHKSVARSRMFWHFIFSKQSVFPPLFICIEWSRVWQFSHF